MQNYSDSAKVRSLPGTPPTDCDKPGKRVHLGVHPSLKWGCFTHPFSGSCWKAVWETTTVISQLCRLWRFGWASPFGRAIDQMYICLNILHYCRKRPPSRLWDSTMSDDFLAEEQLNRDQRLLDQDSPCSFHPDVSLPDQCNTKIHIFKSTTLTDGAL